MNNSKVILITGCSSGFGLYMAARLAASGHKVIATMRDLEKRNPLLNEVSKRGADVVIKRLDVTDKANVKDTVRDVADQYGFLDVLINNAGYGTGGAFEDLTDDEIRQQMETNFFGVQNVTREVIPLMRPRKSGKIINISSISGVYALPHFSAYNSSKWALEAFSEALRYELKFFGIDVLLVEPGIYPTEIFHKNAYFSKNFDNKQSPYFAISQRLRQRVMERVRNCKKDPEEVAALVEKLVNSRNPPFRSQPDLEAKIFLLARKILPFKVFFWLMNKGIFEDSKSVG